MRAGATSGCSGQGVDECKTRTPFGAGSGCISGYGETRTCRVALPGLPCCLVRTLQECLRMTPGGISLGVAQHAGNLVDAVFPMQNLHIAGGNPASRFL